MLVGTAAGGSLGRHTDRYETSLSPQEEVPRPQGVKSTAAGQFVGFYHKRGRILVWVLRFGDLTGPATAAHIHVGARGKPGPVLVPLCGPCRNPSGGRIRLTRQQALPFTPKPSLYVNIHTARNPAGEIRGQLRLVPDVIRRGCQPC